MATFFQRWFGEDPSSEERVTTFRNGSITEPSTEVTTLTNAPIARSPVRIGTTVRGLDASNMLRTVNNTKTFTDMIKELDKTGPSTPKSVKVSLEKLPSLQKVPSVEEKTIDSSLKQSPKKSPKPITKSQRNELIESIKKKYKEQPKKDRDSYLNAILQEGIPANYMDMVFYKERMLPNLKMFVDMGFDKLVIQQADFYDLYHLIYYSGLDKAETTPYTKEEISVLSSMTQYELHQLIVDLNGSVDLKAMNNNQAYMLFYILSGGIIPLIVLTEEQKSKYKTFSKWNPFHILVYVLANLDSFNKDKDFSDYLPYHTAAIIEETSTPVFYQIKKLKPTIPSMNKFLSKLLRSEFDYVQSTDPNTAFLEFIVLLRKYLRGELRF